MFDQSICVYSSRKRICAVKRTNDNKHETDRNQRYIYANKNIKHNSHVIFLAINHIATNPSLALPDTVINQKVEHANNVIHSVFMFGIRITFNKITCNGFIIAIGYHRCGGIFEIFGYMSLYIFMM